MAVIMGVFAWGGRIAVRVLRGAADVVDGLVGLIDAGLDAAGEPAGGPWAGPDEDEADPFERFRAAATARNAADSFADRGGAETRGSSPPATAEDEDERAEDEVGAAPGPGDERAEDGLVEEEQEKDDLEEELGLDAEDDLDAEEGEAEDAADSGGDLDDEEDPTIDVESNVAADLATDVGSGGGPAEDETADDPERDDLPAAAADGLDASPPAETGTGTGSGIVTRGSASRDDRATARVADSEATSFGEAFRARGILAPAPERGSPGPGGPVDAPRAGTRERIAAALGAARSTFESARARRAFGEASSATSAVEGPDSARRKSAKAGRKRDDSEARSARKSKKKGKAKKLAEAKGGGKARKSAGAGKSSDAAPKKAKSASREKGSTGARKKGRKK